MQIRFRLQKGEKEAIANQYADNTVFKLIRVPCRQIEANAKGFRLSPEEVFNVCFRYLDVLKEKPSEALTTIGCLWEDVYCECREFVQDEEAEKSNLETATGTVLYVLFMCLFPLDSIHYHCIVEQLMTKLNDGRGALVRRLRETFSAGLDAIGAEALEQFMADYMDNERFISDEVEDLLAIDEGELMEFAKDVLDVINDKIHNDTGYMDVTYVVEKRKLLTGIYHLTENWGKEGVRWKLLYTVLTEEKVFSKGLTAFVRQIVSFHIHFTNKNELNNFASKIRMNSSLSENRKEWENDYLIIRRDIIAIIEKSRFKI